MCYSIVISFTPEEYKCLIDFCQALDYDVIKWAKTTLLNATKERDDEREEYKYTFN